MPPGAVPEDRLSTIEITPFVSALLLLFFLGRRESAFLRPLQRTGSALLPFGSLVLVNAMLQNSMFCSDFACLRRACLSWDCFVLPFRY